MLTRVKKLSDSQLKALITSVGRLDKWLQKELEIEYEKREIRTIEAELHLEDTGLKWQERIIYLLPIILIITMPLAAKYLGRGEKTKYKEAWQMITLGQILFLLAGIIYFVIEIMKG